MFASTLKEYVVLRVDRQDGFHRELVAESAIEGEALRVARMLRDEEETAAASSALYKLEVWYEVRFSRAGELLDSLPVSEPKYPEEDDEGWLFEFPIRFARIA